MNQFQSLQRWELNPVVILPEALQSRNAELAKTTPTLLPSVQVSFVPIQA